MIHVNLSLVNSIISPEQLNKLKDIIQTVISLETKVFNDNIKIITSAPFGALISAQDVDIHVTIFLVPDIQLRRRGIRILAESIKSKIENQLPKIRLHLGDVSRQKKKKIGITLQFVDGIVFA